MDSAAERNQRVLPGDSLYFLTAVCHYKVSILTLSGIFDEKVGFFSDLLCRMEVSNT